MTSCLLCLHIKTLLTRSALNRKHLLQLHLFQISSPFRRKQNNFDRVISAEYIYQFSLKWCMVIGIFFYSICSSNRM